MLSLPICGCVRGSPFLYTTARVMGSQAFRWIVMSRPRRIPLRGDFAAAAVAELLGLSLADFEARRPALRERDFPEPDPTTGLYCIEAVDRWRLRRHPRLFPELTTAPTAAHADAVFAERMRRLDGQGQDPLLRRCQGARLLAPSPANARARFSDRSLRPGRPGSVGDCRRVE